MASITGVDGVSSVVHCGGGLWRFLITTVAGVNLAKNRLVCSVIKVSRAINFDLVLVIVLPFHDSSSSDLSHFVGWGPYWFCKNTRSLRDRGGNNRVCSFSFSSDRGIRAPIASSLSAQASRQVAHTEGLLNFSLRLIKENASHMGRLKIVSAGEITVRVRCVACLEQST